MWITGDVELPEEVLDAHERGELVFFIGAGASVGSPSNLPLFNELAKQLAKLASHPFEEDGGLDYFIGRLENLPQKFDAHEHTYDIIANPESKYNSIHQAVAELAQSGGAFRVVTTNYDDHLANAADEGGQTPDVWYAPALPLGGQFEGIVHLHGSIRRPNKEMILSDRDFGSAYLTEAWATRFLLPMFRQFTVVFIGYSYNDTIMRYLTLGLSSAEQNNLCKRFAFTTDKPSDAKWQYLGIQPISYPPDDNHEALTAALKVWSSRARMGKADHRALLLDIILGGPRILPVDDRDYLRSRLQSEDGARDFVSAVENLSDKDKLDWLDWVNDLNQFKKLFIPGNKSAISPILSYWFARIYIGSPTLNGAALRTIQHMGQTMSDSLFNAAVWAAKDLYKHDEEAGLRWQTFLSTSVRGQSIPTNGRILRDLVDKSNATELPLLATLLRPSLLLRTSFLLDPAEERTRYPSADISWDTDECLLNQYIQRAVKESDAGEPRLGTILENSMVAAYELLSSYNSKNFDSLSFGRSAIECHEQDSFRRPVDALIDGLRDYGIKALSVRQELPERWWGFEYTLMQRLALHLVAHDESRAADEKLEWLLERTDLYAHNLKHETYRVLAKALPEASPGVKSKVLEVAIAGPQKPDEDSDTARHLAYMKFNLLAWMVRVDSSWEDAEAEFEKIRLENPDFKVREHPDFSSWITSGTYGGTLPMEVDEFLSFVEENTAQALEYILSYDRSRPDFHEPTWDDALSLIKESSYQRPDCGIKLWDETNKSEVVAKKSVDIWKAITRGWGKSELGDSGVEAVGRLESFLPDADSADAIADFLLDQVMSQNELPESAVLAGMRNLARILWDKHGEDYKYPENIPPLSSAEPLYLNSWPGTLARYWASEIGRRWGQTNDSDWNGLNQEESQALISLLSGNSYVLNVTQPAIAGELFFYFAADEVFAQKHILSLFGDPQRHAFAWFPFLQTRRYNDRLLAAGLFQNMLEEFDRLHEVPEENVRSYFLNLVVSVLSYSGISDSERENLLNRSITANNGAYAVDFAQAVTRCLQGNETATEDIWRQWLGKHLCNRVKGIPREAKTDEIAAWADLVPYLGGRIPEAVEILNGKEPYFTDNYLNLDIPVEAFREYGNCLVAFITERIRSTDNLEPWARYQVQNLVQQIAQELGDATSQPLLDAARDKGFIPPSD